MRPLGVSRAERVRAGRAAEEARRGLPSWARWALTALLVLLFSGAALLLRSGFSKPLLKESDLTNRLINPERVTYDAETGEISLAFRGQDYRLASPLWNDLGDGEAVVAALPVGQGMMVWVPQADTALTVQQVMAVEAAALTVPKGVGLRAMQAPARSSRWSGIVALMLAGYVAVLLISRRRIMTEM